jgi:FtsZ-binding cell division protein ZapB
MKDVITRIIDPIKKGVSQITDFTRDTYIQTLLSQIDDLRKSNAQLAAENRNLRDSIEGAIAKISRSNKQTKDYLQTLQGTISGRSRPD